MLKTLCSLLLMLCLHALALAASTGVSYDDLRISEEPIIGDEKKRSNALTKSPFSTNSLTIYTEEFPPYNYLDNGQPSGINVKLVEQICLALDIKCTFYLYPWNRAMRMTVDTPNSAIISTSRTEKRQGKFKWVGPIASGTSCVYALATRNDISINSMAELTNYRMGISTDTAYNKAVKSMGFEEGENLFVYPGKFGTLKPFVMGRVDFIIGSAMSISSQLDFVDLNPGYVVPVAIIDAKYLNGNYIALNLQTDSKLVEAMQQTLDMMKETEQLTRIKEQFQKESKYKRPEKVAPSLWSECMSEY